MGDALGVIVGVPAAAPGGVLAGVVASGTALTLCGLGQSNHIKPTSTTATAPTTTARRVQ